jgi:hypothetical protein
MPFSLSSSLSVRANGLRGPLAIAAHEAGRAVAGVPSAMMETTAGAAGRAPLAAGQGPGELPQAMDRSRAMGAGNWRWIDAAADGTLLVSDGFQAHRFAGDLVADLDGYLWILPVQPRGAEGAGVEVLRVAVGTGRAETDTVPAFPLAFGPPGVYYAALRDADGVLSLVRYARR